ncbi:MAG: sugar phosphate isomerase/epimerase [Planctomycetia bacterium]|nr:sugar phosphate isomerase/epimerase [Planctomycetia bacterium]
MFVAVSNRCFPDIPLNHCLGRLADLEYSAVEIAIGDKTCDLKPEWILEDLSLMARYALCCRQITPVSFFFDVETDDPQYYEKFDACCKLAQKIKVVPITIKSSLLGTPYNEEFERLRRLARMGVQQGLIIGVLTEIGRFTESPESVLSLCKNIPELSVTLDPSCYIYQREHNIDYDSIIDYVCHVRLRDTTQKHFQVQIGLGILEYGRLVIQLNKSHYQRALCADLAPLPDINQESELRKMRLLIESIL